MSDALIGQALAWLAMLSFAAATLVAKPAAARVPLGIGFLVATGTNVLVAAVVCGVQQLLPGVATRWDSNAVLLFLGSGVLATYLGRWFFYEAVARFGPAKASVFQVSSPLFTALLAWLFLGETLGAGVLLAMGVVVAGLLLVSAPSAAVVPSLSTSEPVVNKPWAERVLASVFILGVGSSLAYAGGSVLRGAAIRSWNEPLLGGLLGALSGLALHLIFTRGKRDLWVRLRTADRRGVALYGWMGLFTMAGQILAIASMRFIPVSVAGLVTLCTPLVVIPLSAWLFSQQSDITPRLCLGTALALSGMAVVILR